jgi:hypothetical protein
LDGSGRPELETIARRIRLLIPSTSGGIRAELESIRNELEALVGARAEVIALASRRT